jgi:ubiquinone/menaquinone biosynthesis C-methylase UbiE
VPDLSTSIHLDMLRARRRLSLFDRFRRAKRELFREESLYGLEWGDPENVPPLRYVRDHYVRRFVNPDHTALEIGPGGGRWTRYLIEFQKIYLVDYHAELLTELRKNFHRPNMDFVKNNGADFPGVPDHSIDFLFSFGVFVHLDLPLIRDYLASMRRILKPTANVVLQYSDKTKILAQTNEGFSDNTPDQMREIVRNTGFCIVEEDVTSLWHSALIRFSPQR